MNNNQDKKDWQNFIFGKEKLPDKDISYQKKFLFKTKSIDLHGYTLEQANSIIEGFIHKSFTENINKLIVVTGKGLHSHNQKNPYVSKDLSILKYSVPEYIKSKPDLMKLIQSINDDSINNSTKGSFELCLKKFKE